MKLPFKILIVLLVLPALVFASENPKFKGKYTKSKTINKEYTVNPEAGLEVVNRYGNIDIITWNENRTIIEVVITTNGNNEEMVQKKLNEINVEFSATASMVIAKTLFKGKKNKSWNLWGKNKNNIGMEINYTIKLPVTNSVDLSNDYGTISINNLNGNARISCDYGQVNIGALNADNNYLNFDYTQNSTIGYMKSGKINADYSGFVLKKTERLELNADYTGSEITEAADLNYNCDYGKLNVGKANKIIGRGDYTPLKVGTLSGSMNINTDYGSVTVDRITDTAGDITIRSDYAGIQLGYDTGYHFDFTIDLYYASLKGKDDLEILNTSKDNSNKFYSGYHGSKDSGNTINIKSDYGGVTLKRN
jgi:hypothetical protein